jgi:hypothetical protein
MRSEFSLDNKKRAPIRERVVSSHWIMRSELSLDGSAQSEGDFLEPIALLLAGQTLHTLLPISKGEESSF